MGSRGMDASVVEGMKDSGLMQLLGGFTIFRMANMMGVMGAEGLTREQLLALIARLITIQKP